MEALGERIRARRERLGLTQRDVANGLQVTAQAVSKWERGENAPDASVLLPLSRLLGVSLDWLLGGHGPDAEGGRPQEVFEATVMVADLTGFSNATVELSERDAAAWLNGRLYQITEAVLRHDGITVKYVGDTVLALFAGNQHRDRAVRAAFLARRTTDTLVHVGLDAGSIFAGRVGHPEYARLDILGRCVFGAFGTERWAARNTVSHVAATEAVTSGLTDTVTTAETGMLPTNASQLGVAAETAVFGLALPA